MRINLFVVSGLWLVVLTLSTFAQIVTEAKLTNDSGANWVSAAVKTSWDRKLIGFCMNETMCLVNPKGDPNFDGMPEKFYTATQSNDGDKPRCLKSGQSILDYYCEGG